MQKDENPENWEWQRTSILMKDGTWLTEDKSRKVDIIEVRKGNDYWSERHPYLYFTHSGNNQSTMATIWVEEREWLYKPTGERKISKDVEISFDDELGTQAGSWKGGVVGCSYQMLPHETPLQTLRRMEKERSFR